MSSVYVLDIGTPRMPRNGRQLNGIGGNSYTSVTTGIGTTAPPVTALTPDIVAFTANALPTVTDYNTLYAPKHGQYPRIDMIIDNGDGTRYRSQLQPQFTTLTSGGGQDDLIDTIFFDIGEELTGWIIIY